MKTFDLEAAKRGEPVINRGGHKARIICFDANNDEYPLIALINISNNTDKAIEIPVSYSRDGKYSTNGSEPDDYDLMMVDLPAEKTETNQYARPCKGANIDVYDVLIAFNVVNPAVQHAIKKLLAAGQRGYKDIKQDYQEARTAIDRALEMEI